MNWNYGGNGSRTKYHNRRITIGGETFDSLKEASRYTDLKIMQEAGMIHGLERQKKYTLVPVQREPDTVGKRGGRHRGKVIEAECAYYADFVYYDADGVLVVEDVKSPATRTKDYIIKRKLMLYVHGIRVKEV